AVVTQGVRPVAAVADAGLPRWGRARPRAASDGYPIEDLPLDVVAKRLPDLLASRALQPEYDEQWLAWLLGLAQQMDPQRVVRRRLVRDAHQEPVGWFFYRVEPGGLAEVLQLVARKDARAPVFDALLSDVWSTGATMVAGRL